MSWLGKSGMNQFGVWLTEIGASEIPGPKTEAEYARGRIRCLAHSQALKRPASKMFKKEDQPKRAFLMWLWVRGTGID